MWWVSFMTTYQFLSFFTTRRNETPEAPFLLPLLCSPLPPPFLLLLLLVHTVFRDQLLYLLLLGVFRSGRPFTSIPQYSAMDLSRLGSLRSFSAPSQPDISLILSTMGVDVKYLELKYWGIFIRIINKHILFTRENLFHLCKWNASPLTV